MADKQKAGSILRLLWLLNFFNSFSLLSFFILSRSFICFVFYCACTHMHLWMGGIFIYDKLNRMEYLCQK